MSEPAIIKVNGLTKTYEVGDVPVHALRGVDLEVDPTLWIADDGASLPVGVSARIGVTKAAERELRFYARGNPSVSGPRALSP